LPSATSDRVAVAFIAVGTALRFVWVLLIHPPFDYVYSDMAGYVSRGALIASGEPLTRYDAFQPTGTQTLLALPFSIFGSGRAGMWAAAVLWAALSSATLFFAWRLARGWLSPRAAALLAALFALWPLHVFESGYFLSETPSLAFLTAALWLMTGGASARTRLAGGALGGLAVACRPELALNLVIAAVVAARRHGRGTMTAVACGFLVVALAVVAWNSSIAKRPVLFSQNAGFVFFEGQCEARVVTGGYPSRPFSIGAPALLQRHAGRDFTFPGTPVYDQAFFFRRGLDCIADNGVGHVGTVAASVLDMTATSIPWPEADEPGAVRDIARITNLGYSLLLPVLVLLGLLGVRRGHTALAQPLMQLATPFAGALIFLSEPRHRALYDVFGLMLLAALATTAAAKARHESAHGP
jgi:hypothetical protein